VHDPSPYDENALLLQCAGGDQSAFRTLFMQWHQLLAGYLFRITESRELTEDLVQEVFLKIWVARESLAEVRHFRLYLLAMSRNHAYDALKKQLKEQTLQRIWMRETAEDPRESEDPEICKAALIDAAIDSLPPRRKEVYLLSRHERLTYQEIATRLGISRESVKTHIELATSGISRFIREHLWESLAFFIIFLKNH
jgi:RNA polymerase sigma-70 factor (ECF subfamily)